MHSSHPQAAMARTGRDITLTRPSLAMSLHVSLGGYEKSVKGATKPKPTLPKEKYMQPILKAAEGSSTNLQDVFWALQGRLEDPNSIVCAKDELTTQTVFKSLFVLHTMIRSSAATAVLSYLAGDPSAIRLARVASVGLNEYTYSKLLVKYAKLLEQRILTFQELGYDVVLAGKRDRFARLRKMSVSKGLLREITVIQNMMKPLMECTFFQQESPNELVVAAFQMILKDLLSFYSAMNEGIINMLGMYNILTQNITSKCPKRMRSSRWRFTVAFASKPKMWSPFWIQPSVTRRSCVTAFRTSNMRRSLLPMPWKNICTRQTLASTKLLEKVKVQKRKTFHPPETSRRKSPNLKPLQASKH